jgi:hypothetical protein
MEDFIVCKPRSGRRQFLPAPRASARFRRAIKAVFHVSSLLAAERLWPEAPPPERRRNELTS